MQPRSILISLGTSRSSWKVRDQMLEIRIVTIFSRSKICSTTNLRSLLMSSLINCLKLLLWTQILCANALQQSPGMWNLVNVSMILIIPEDAACAFGRTFCVPIVTSQNVSSSIRCFPALCSAQNRNLSTMTDGDLGSSFVTKRLDRFEILVKLGGKFDVSSCCLDRNSVSKKLILTICIKLSIY